MPSGLSADQDQPAQLARVLGRLARLPGGVDINRARRVFNARISRGQTVIASLVAAIAVSRVSAAAKETEAASVLPIANSVEDLLALSNSDLCIPDYGPAQGDGHDHGQARGSHDGHGAAHHWLDQDPFASRYANQYDRAHEGHGDHNAGHHGSSHEIHGDHTAHSEQGVHHTHAGHHGNHVGHHVGAGHDAGGHDGHAGSLSSHAGHVASHHNSDHGARGHGAGHQGHESHAAHGDHAADQVSAHEEHAPIDVGEASTGHEPGHDHTSADSVAAVEADPHDGASVAEALSEPATDVTVGLDDKVVEALGELDLDEPQEPAADEVASAHDHHHHHGATLAALDAPPVDDLGAATPPLI